MKVLLAFLFALITWAAATAQTTVKLYTANLSHGVGTDALFHYQRQLDYMADGDILAVQERSTGDTGWNTPLSNTGFVEAVCRQNSSIADDNCIWVKSSTVTVNATYTHALSDGFVGWDGTTDVDKSAVAAKVTVGGKQFYVVSTHLCWSRCADSQGSQFSAKRVAQATELLSWIGSTLTGGLDVVILGDMNFAPDYPKSPSGLQIDLFTANYTDLWQAGITAGTATAPWGDRDGDGNADMPIGNLTTRTADYRRIDYAFLNKNPTALSLSGITVIDTRAQCPHALVAGGALPGCSPEVTGGPVGDSPNQWDIPEDFGVRPADHNWIRATLIVGDPPDTPTNKPRAHPLAPNPHTSVGLFWIYTDPGTGRQSTAVSYKVKRCAGVGCTPTTVIASGLSSADYQDTGLSPNTTYGYRYVASAVSDSVDSPTTYVTTLEADSNMVQFPDTTWSNMLGPLPESAQIPFAYFRDTMTAQGADVISKYPVVGPGVLLGTGSITNGTTTLTGTNTFFLEQVAANNPACLDNILINGVNAGAIASVNSNTSINLAATWNGGTQTNVTLSTNDSVGGACGGNDPLSNWLTGNQLMYYDSPLALWQIYFMTGDPQYMRGAIRGSEAMFAGLMWLGRNRAWQGFSTTPDAPVIPPRNFQFSGYTLLGMAGHSGVWDLLDKYLTDFYAAWISNYRGGTNNFTYPREKAYMIRFVNDFIIAAPDSFPRSNGTTTSLNGGTTVDGDLVDGRKDFWRDQLDIDIPGFITDDHRAEGFWTDNGFSNATADGDYPYVQGTEITGPAQPAFQGLMADALGFCWRNTALSTTARNAARRLVLRTVAAMGHLAYNTNLIPQDTSKRWRFDWYFSLGGTRLNPYAFQYGADRFVLNDTPYTNSAALSRQGLPLMLSSFGWAKAMAGSNNSWYEAMALEMANAAFAAIGENTGGTGDGLKTLCDSDANYKDFGQCFRMAARFFGEWLSSAGTLATAPTVTMPANITLTGGVNQAVLPAPVVVCPNGGCTYRWSLQEYPMINNPRYEPMPVFTDVTTLATKLCGLEPGVYKLIFYTLDALGLEGHGTMNVTVGDGVYPPVATIGYGNPSAEEQHQYFTTSSSLSGSSRCYSVAGRTVTHSYVLSTPKDKSATLTPASTTSNVSTFSITGLSAGLWIVTDTCTDSAGTPRKTIMYIRHSTENQPSSAHNTIPTVGVPPHHVLPAGSSSTRLFVVPRDPEGIVGYINSAAGYTQGELGAAEFLVTALTHSWTQTAGPVSATITNGTTIRPDITGLSVAGTYTFRYIGTDQQGDTTTPVDINVTVTAGGITVCKWSTAPPCQTP